MKIKSQRRKLIKHRFMAMLLVLITLTLTACPSTKTPIVDKTPPTILSLNPSFGSRGITANAKMIIEFSEEMDKPSAEAAFRESNLNNVLPIVTKSFSWSADAKIMTVSLKAGLEYSQNDKHKVYGYKITTVARDLAGNKLDSAQQTIFSTYRTVSKKIIADAALDGYIWSDNTKVRDSRAHIQVGDWDDNAYTKGFLSFNLPEGIFEIKRAKLAIYQYDIWGTPYASLGHLLRLDITHVNYGSTLDFADFNTKQLNQIGKNCRVLTNGDSGQVAKQGWCTLNVTNWVSKDVSNTNTSVNSQFRLEFANNTDGDNAKDGAIFYSANSSNSKKPYLEISYLSE